MVLEVIRWATSPLDERWAVGERWERWEQNNMQTSALLPSFSFCRDLCTALPACPSSEWKKEMCGPSLVLTERACKSFSSPCGAVNSGDSGEDSSSRGQWSLDEREPLAGRNILNDGGSLHEVASDLIQWPARACGLIVWD